MINSITLSTIKNSKRAIAIIVLGLCFLYLITLVNSKSATNLEHHITAITMHKSAEPIDISSVAPTISWHKLKSGKFNLGKHQYALVKIQLAQSKTLSPDGLILAIANNNVFNDAVLHYQQNNLFLNKTLKASTNDGKLLSIKLFEETLPEQLFLSLSGRYLRGELLIYTPREFTQYIKMASIKDGIYFGITALFLLISWLSYMYSRQSIFLKYSALLSVMFLWVAAGEGWIKSYFPQTHALPFFTANSLGLLFFIIFTNFSIYYLKLDHNASKSSWLLKYSQRLLLFIWLCYCLSFNRSEPTLYQAIYGLALFTCLIVLVTSFIAALRSLPALGKQGGFYIAAFVVFLFCGITSGLSMTNIINFHIGWTLIKTSSIAEMILLASGLMYWYQNSLTKLVNEQKKYNEVQMELISTKQQLAENENLLETKQSNISLCPQIAKVVTLIDKALYIKAAGNYSEIIYLDGKVVKVILVESNLQAIENALGSEKLIRCHKSYLINRNLNFKLTRRTSADFDLVIGQHHVPVGRKYLKDTRLIFNKK